MGQRPDFVARAVVQKAKNQNEKDFFQTIGAAWQRQNGEGFTVKLQTVPVQWDGSFVLMPPRDGDE